MGKTYKIYTIGSIYLAAFIGGPLVAGYLTSKNFQTLGNKNEARKWLFFGVFASILELIIIIFFISDKVRETPLIKVAPIIYAIFFSYFAEIAQRKEIAEYKGETASAWKAVGVGILGFGIQLILIGLIALYYVFVSPVPFKGSRMVFGQINHEVYYQEGIDSREVKQLGETLIKSGYFGNAQMACQLKEFNEGYVLYLPSDKNYWNDEKFLKECQDLQNYLNQNAGMKKKIRIILIDFDKFFSKQIEKTI